MSEGFSNKQKVGFGLGIGFLVLILLIIVVLGLFGYLTIVPAEEPTCPSCPEQTCPVAKLAAVPVAQPKSDVGSLDTNPPPTAFTAANGTKYVLTTARRCSMIAGAPDGLMMQEMIDNCATTTKLDGVSPCLGILQQRDADGAKIFFGCVATEPTTEPVPEGHATWIVESELTM